MQKLAFILTAFLLVSCSGSLETFEKTAGREDQATKSEVAGDAPEVVSPIESVLIEGIGGTFTVDLSQHFSDPAGGALTYSTTQSVTGLVDLKLSGASLTGKTYAYGRTEINVVAKNAAGLRAEIPFAVLCREKDSGVSVYPNPVRPDEDGNYYLYVCGGQETEMRIELYTASGSLAWSHTLTSSVFSPAVIDMTNFASGKYNVRVFMNGELYTHSIVKL